MTSPRDWDAAEPFVAALLDGVPRDPTIAYVRLNIDAVA